ncbi:hypothetical protein ERO09_00090 [Haemophilus parainfluenzae]|nr:VENN motif pre-toxin domain-containing protein [Haemophilus parainfluenzae]KAB1991527.1 hypothetical protein F8M38_07600 [Haemophilus parainfluenzae]QAT94493.1 hypothetical protein ERO09_00090 [Haemophilus parainfluenzae]
MYFIYGFSADGSFNKSKINADHASVNEQAGIYAGDEGYDVNVKNHTDLKGALITSTQKAEADGKNHFSTGSITHSDIENHSNYSGSSFGVSGSVSANFETPFGENGAAQSTKQATDKDGNLLYTDKNGNKTVNSKGVDGKENTKKLAEGKESLQFSYGMGYGKDSDSQSSTTKSGINTQNIIIKDEAEQLKRTGKTVQEEIAAIKTDITTESAPSQSGKLENRFDKDDVQKELDFQREVTEKFGPNVVEAGSLLANKFGEEAKAKRNEAAIALEEAEKAKAENNNETNRALVKQARDNFETASRKAKEWETGGSQRLVIDSALNVISTALAGRPAAEVVASGLSPAVNNQIKKATTDAKGNVNMALNLTAHALWGAVEAYAGNRNVAAGAAGAAGGEVAAHFLASTLYNKSPENLSEEEKRTVSSLSQVAAGIAGGSLSDSSDGAIIAAKTAKNAVENNSFTLESVINNPQEDWGASAKAQEKISEAEKRAIEQFAKRHPKLINNLKATGDVASFLADFTPVLGDAKSFAEAEDAIDYALATVGVVFPPLKSFKKVNQMARTAEKAGNATDVLKYQKEAIKQFENVKALDVNSYKNLKQRSIVGDNLDLDHIPSFAALKKEKENKLGRKLSPIEEKTLRDEATAIAVPKDTHINSRTYGGKNTKAQIVNDASNLCYAQECDINHMRKSLIDKGYDSLAVEEAINEIIIRNKNRGIK